MAYDVTKNTNLGQLKALALRAQTEIEALNNASIKSVKVNGTALTVTDGAVDVLIGVVKKATANNGYAASYQITANGTALATEIDIPKDFLVKSASMEICETADTPIAGLTPGDPYLDFVVNTVDTSETDQHIYINVASLVDVYLAGNGIDITGTTVSVKIDTTNANGLSVGANGLALGLATDSAAGAMSAADHAQFTADSTKLANISVEANKTTVTTEGSGAIEIDGSSKTVVYIATDAEVTEMLNEVFGAPASNEG